MGTALGIGLGMAGFTGGCQLIAGVKDAVPYPTDSGGGAGGGATSSSTGGAPTCMPGTSIACYSGKDEQKGVGQCKAGTKTCNAEGTAYDGCMGEVLPGTESCKTPGDEDCDGSACSDCVWSFLAGDVYQQFPTGMAVDSSGNIVVVGNFSGTLKLQNKAAGTSVTLSATGPSDFFIAKFDTKGDVLWAKGFGAVNGLGPDLTVAVDADGNIGIAGGLAVSTNFGGNLLSVVGYEDIFAVKFDAEGKHVWSKSFGGSQFSFSLATALTFDSKGNLVVGAKSNSDITIGTKSFTGTGYDDALIMTMTGDAGDVIWVKQYKEASSQMKGNQSITRLTTDPFNFIYIAGTFSGGICLIATASGCANTVGGNQDTDIFVASLDPTGNANWAQILGTAKQDTATGIAVAASGDVIVTGAIGGSFDFNGHPQNVTSVGQHAFLAKYTTLGTYVSARIFENSGGSAPSSIGIEIATDESDNIYLAGSMAENVSLGGDVLVNGGPGSATQDIFLGKFDEMLNPLWSKSFGDAKSQNATALRYDHAGKQIVLAGQVAGKIDFGTGALQGMSGITADLALAKFQP
jgi:hypothetical protein